ncbi:hypothetical protein GCM10011409_24860 [Lentibacillus populi]|uniref:Uncharacterized protein n=1 Tax=Lentibacillus populi TaxID=1827502 RepID=A0A9W5X6C5_9BACI|nr:hypothetical protein [Lentibacillus populi]GGB46315.1 hypothetical protein GCM10011409_24860 [Lentibacillus populi]
MEDRTSTVVIPTEKEVKKNEAIKLLAEMIRKYSLSLNTNKES